MPRAKVAKKPATKTTATKTTKAAAKKKTVKKNSVKKPIAKNTASKKTAAKQQSSSKRKSARPAETHHFDITKPIVKIGKDYIPSEKEPYMNPSHLEYFRCKLMDWKKELLSESNETLEHLKEESWNEPDVNDRATVETDAALELRTRDRYRKLISKIDSALRRIALGDYGYCEDTGEPIGLRRLDARPTATLSIQAQERHEKHEKQYNDED